MIIKKQLITASLIAMFCIQLSTLKLFANQYSDEVESKESNGINSYYVNNVDGNDTNRGDKDNPFQSIAKACSMVRAGESIIVIATEKNYSEPIKLLHSGTAHRWITIKGASREKKPIITGQPKGALLTSHDASYLIIRDMIFKDSQSGLMLSGEFSNIKLENLEISNIRRNGIVITGNSNSILIDSCLINQIHNSGIVLHGNKYNGVSNTLIQNCKIYSIETNDGITLHKNSKGDDIGNFHIIRDNTIFNCGEQGIDITSGGNIELDNNHTFRNGVSGVIVGHNVENVVINRHVSENEKKFGIIIGPSKNIVVSNSKIKDSILKAQILVYGGRDIRFDNNQIIFSNVLTPHSIIDLKSGVKNLIFKKNKIHVSGKFKGAVVRFMSDEIENINTWRWEENGWNFVKPGITICSVSGTEKINFEEFKRIYAHDDYQY